MMTLIRWQVLALLTLTRLATVARGALPTGARAGQGMAEYAVIGSIIITIVVVGLTVLANALSDYFQAFAVEVTKLRPT